MVVRCQGFHIFYEISSEIAVMSALCAGRPLPPGRFLVYISVKRLSRPQGHSAAGRIRSIEKSSDFGNRTCNIAACSIVPQRNTLPSCYINMWMH
jgi:hypothetical protein